MEKLTEKDKIRIAELYKKNVSTKIIAEQFGVTRGGILYILRKRKVLLRPKHKWNKYYFNEHFFDVIDTEEKAYILGFLYADGCNYEKYRKISVELAARDVDILEKIKKAINSDYILYEWYRITKKKEKRRYLSLSLCSEHFSKRCFELGLVHRKSKILKFPNPKMVSDELLRHFIRGYFDGDGSISFYKNRPSMSIIATTVFCNDLKRVVNDCIGVHGAIIPNNETVGMSYFRIGTTFGVLEFFEWLYKDATIFLDRKYNKYQKSKMEYLNSNIRRNAPNRRKLELFLNKHKINL